MTLSVRRVSSIALLSSSAIFALAACTSMFLPKPSADPVSEEGQNWNWDQRQRWYVGSQGSRLIPERWFRSLEAPDQTELFLSSAYFDRFNYLEPVEGGLGLPLGFARDQQDDDDLYRTRLRWFAGQSDEEPWVGLNCAACHTNKLTFQGNSVLVDGAPTLGDFQGLLEALREAMKQTYERPDKWNRFAARVLAPRVKDDASQDTPSNRTALRRAVNVWLSNETTLAKMNETDVRYGFGRLDAVGHILNKVAFLNTAEDQFPGEPDAPVSYPFLWNVPQHDRLQWNGIVPNEKIKLGFGSFDIGALVRNTSEVIGVFADVRIVDEPSASGYESSVRVRNLVAMEKQLEQLTSPAWPAAFGPIDSRKKRHGARLFKRDCAGCHALLDRTDLRTPITAEMTPLFDPIGLNTDPWMACNAYTYRAKAGLLNGDPIRVLRSLSVEGNPKELRLLPPVGSTAAYLQAQAVGVLLAKKWSVLWNAIRVWSGFPPVITDPDARGFVVQREQLPKADRLTICKRHAENPPPDSNAEKLLAYKGRPLNGIWATAPYLHNGSVRTLYQLLLHPDEREESFWVGNREFDPEQVGFVNSRGKVGQELSVTGDGNSNQGHYYRAYQPAERWALVEYMKSL